jgi:hypothetical protein
MVTLPIHVVANAGDHLAFMQKGQRPDMVDKITHAFVA